MSIGRGLKGKKGGCVTRGEGNLSKEEFLKMVNVVNLEIGKML